MENFVHKIYEIFYFSIENSFKLYDKCNKTVNNFFMSLAIVSIIKLINLFEIQLNLIRNISVQNLRG